jgi:8-oxo-dGTP diphosphatase
MVQQHTPPSDSREGSTGSTPGSSLRVCVALFRWSGTELETATCENGHLPCARPNPDEPLEVTAERVVRAGAHVDAQYVEQLYTFSRSVGNDREIVISYLGLFSPETFTRDHTGTLAWTPAGATTLADDIERMVLEYAVVRLRAKLGYTNIAFNLVPSTFTLSELQHAYESILGQPMDKRNFRRRMIASGILTNTNETRREGSHRPAALYRFSEQEDSTSYLTPPWQSES